MLRVAPDFACTVGQLLSTSGFNPGLLFSAGGK
jgi:hypothetical protein